MISGARLLEEDRPFSFVSFTKRNTLPLLLLFFVWSLLYVVIDYVIPTLAHDGTVDKAVVLRSFFTGHYHLWYLPMLIGKYLTVPFLRCLTKRENRELVRRFLLIAFCIKALSAALACFPEEAPLPAALRSFSEGLETDFFLHYTGYFVLGWYLRSFGLQDKLLRRAAYGLALISAAGMISWVILTGEYVKVYIDVDIVFLFPSIVLFDLISGTTPRLSDRTQRILPGLSGLTLRA